MAVHAIHPYTRHHGPVPGGSGPTLTVIEGRRGKPEMLVVRATEIADLIDELTAAGMDMVALASRLDIAVRSDRVDLVPEVAVRLRRLGEMYRDCAKPIGAA